MIRVILTAPAKCGISRTKIAEAGTLEEVIEQLSGIFRDIEHFRTTAHLQAWLSQKAKSIKAEADFFAPSLQVTESAYDWPKTEV